MKKAIIIGASSGIGKGIALELLKKNYKIAISARRIERLEEIKSINPDNVIIKEFDSSTEQNDKLLSNLVDKLANAGAVRFAIHARKALLNGLSPKQNREIPPLNYNRVGLLFEA